MLSAIAVSLTLAGCSAEPEAIIIETPAVTLTPYATPEPTARPLPTARPSPTPHERVTVRSGARININTAGPRLLESLPRIGPATAQRIIDYRQTHGPFKAIEDIQNVPGIGEATFNAIKDRITVDD
ncbi:MAG: ComEA family DNA-binding protein [Anaerolineae bacterium]